MSLATIEVEFTKVDGEQSAPNSRHLIRTSYCDLFKNYELANVGENTPTLVTTSLHLLKFLNK
jgi:hypothetical protein